MDNDLDPSATVDPTIHDGDPSAALYPCPHCGLERPAVDFLTRDGQSYNPYCSVCMAGYAEAMGLQDQQQQQQHPHDELTLGGESLAHEGDALQHHHSQLNVHQLLAAQVVDANLAADHDAATGGLMGHHHHHHGSVLGVHSSHHHEQLLLAQAGELGDPDADALAAYHDVHVAALGYTVGSSAGNNNALSGVEEHPEGSKQCSRCKMLKVLEEFPLLKAKHKGRAAHCFSCRSVSAPSAARHQGTSCGASETSADILGALTMHLQHPSNLPEGFTPMVLEKRCGQCSLVKPSSAFRRTRNKTDHLQSRCRECEQALGRGTKRTSEDGLMVKVTRKVCIRCGLDKFASEFFTAKKALDGLYTYCKPCHKELNRQSREKQQSAQVGPPPATKLCTMCKEDKPAEQFYKGRMSTDGLYTYCKACATKMDTKRKREYRQRRKAAQAAEEEETGGSMLRGNNNALDGGGEGVDRSYDNIPELAELAGDAAAAAAGQEGEGIGMQYTNAVHQRYHTTNDPNDPHSALVQTTGTGTYEGYVAPHIDGIEYHSKQYPQHEQYQYDEAAAAAEAAVAVGYDPASVMHYAEADQTQYYQQLYAQHAQHTQNPEAGVGSYVNDAAVAYTAADVEPNGSTVFAGAEPVAGMVAPLAPEDGDGTAVRMHVEKRVRKGSQQDS